MRHLNYNHLQYFWVVAREGSIARAAEVLHVTPQTISGQIRLLEEAIGRDLFDRPGRRLVLTPLGRVVFDYADDIFSLGAELSSMVRGGELGAPTTLDVGVVDSVPKLIAERLLAPALTAEPPVRVRCHESTLEALLGDLAVHRLDLVLSDQPVPEGLSLRAHDQLLGSSGLSFFAAGEARQQAGEGDFPALLDDAPVLLPTPRSALRRRLDEWLEDNDVTPRVVGEFDDSALLKAFGMAGAGLFPAPSVIADEVCRMYGAVEVGRTDDLTERFYAITADRRVSHDTVQRVTEAAAEQFASEPSPS